MYKFTLYVKTDARRGESDEDVRDEIFGSRQFLRGFKKNICKNMFTIYWLAYATRYESR